MLHGMRGVIHLVLALVAACAPATLASPSPYQPLQSQLLRGINHPVPGVTTLYRIYDVPNSSDALRYPRNRRGHSGVPSLAHVHKAEPLWTYNTSRVWDVPHAVDWSGSGAVSKVIHHGKCGSCFAASAKDALESAYYMATGHTTDLSLQDILDCSWAYSYDNETNAGCDGGAYEAVFAWAADHGVVLDHPGSHYLGNNSDCPAHREVFQTWKPRGYVEVPGDEALIMHALAHAGPLAVSMYTAYPAFDKYPGHGAMVLPPANCSAVTSKALDHSMLLVGYGETADGIRFWKVKNNWGMDWGDLGYFFLVRDRDCGLRLQVAYVV